MSLFIEPGAATVEVAGEPINIKILTGRERVAVSKKVVKIGQMTTGYSAEDLLPPALGLRIQDVNYEILAIGLEIDPDTINPQHWGALVSEVWKANNLSGEDSKN